MAELPNHRHEQTGNAVIDRLSTNVRDLISFVRGLAQLTQNRAYAALAIDTTAGVSTYATLLTATITTALTNGYVLITFTASGLQLTSTGTVYFQVVVDGKVIKGTHATVAGGQAWCVSMIVRVPVTSGLHTVLLQWDSDVTGARINGKSANEDHAQMVVEEVYQ
jgi:hypothetical protein